MRAGWGRREPLGAGCGPRPCAGRVRAARGAGAPGCGRIGGCGYRPGARARALGLRMTRATALVGVMRAATAAGTTVAAGPASRREGEPRRPRASRSHVTAYPVPTVPGPPLPRPVEPALTFAVLLAARRGTAEYVLLPFLLPWVGLVAVVPPWATLTLGALELPAAGAGRDGRAPALHRGGPVRPARLRLRARPRPADVERFGEPREAPTVAGGRRSHRRSANRQGATRSPLACPLACHGAASGPP